MPGLSRTEKARVARAEGRKHSILACAITRLEGPPPSPSLSLSQLRHARPPEVWSRAFHAGEAQCGLCFSHALSAASLDVPGKLRPRGKVSASLASGEIQTGTAVRRRFPFTGMDSNKRGEDAGKSAPSHHTAGGSEKAPTALEHSPAVPPPVECRTAPRPSNSIPGCTCKRKENTCAHKDTRAHSSFRPKGKQHA